MAAPSAAPIEFLDHEWFYESVPPAPLPEPWRRHRFAARCFWLPRAVLFQVAQPERLTTISRDVERLSAVRASLEAVGLERPLELVVDDDGRIVLRDGHHRLLCSEGIAEFERFPVLITRSSGIAVPAPRAADLLEVLLRSAAPVSG